MNLVRIATWSEVPEAVPTAAMAENVDLVIVRRGDEHSVLHGRCLHRGALLADGTIVGAHGTRVTHSSQLDDALAAAFAHDGPSLVEVMTDADLV